MWLMTSVYVVNWVIDVNCLWKCRPPTTTSRPTTNDETTLRARGSFPHCHSTTVGRLFLFTLLLVEILIQNFSNCLTEKSQQTNPTKAEPYPSVCKGGGNRFSRPPKCWKFFLNDWKMSPRNACILRAVNVSKCVCRRGLSPQNHNPPGEPIECYPDPYLNMRKKWGKGKKKDLWRKKRGKNNGIKRERK